jgi:hypothetical protein
MMVFAILKKIVVICVQIFFVGFVRFLVLPCRVAAATKSATTEFTRASDSAITTTIIARRQCIVEFADEVKDGHFFIAVCCYTYYNTAAKFQFFFMPLLLEAEYQRLQAEAIAS